MEILLRAAGPVHDLVIDAGNVKNQAHNQGESWGSRGSPWSISSESLAPAPAPPPYHCRPLLFPPLSSLQGPELNSSFLKPLLCWALAGCRNPRDELTSSSHPTPNLPSRSSQSNWGRQIRTSVNHHTHGDTRSKGNSSTEFCGSRRGTSPCR